MKQQNHFNTRRLLLLFKRDIIQSYKALLVTSGALFATILFLLFVSTSNGASREIPEGLFLSLLWIGGFIFTSICFRETHSSSQIHNWLMTPASPLEKFIEKLLLTTVFYVLALIIGFFLATCLNSLIYLIIFKQAVPLFNPAQSWVWLNISHYLVIQSIFFLGAIWFRKYNFIKTVLTINILQILLALTVGGIASLTYWGPIREFLNGNPDFFEQSSLIMNLNFHHLNPLLKNSLKLIYFVVVAPFFWFISWIRMREIEVKDGI
ncbi:hypothetical protein EXM22_16010 [Oceanispirochaeta crateris]|uniref:Uncharacterized protein n=1 Tax=Oceanispirochaeta crateris TaxID=2518645 RepID=A0A5C1QQD3_9SPIO|nr:hypothetical protein [Oceanispirochaeta crateris]QEN09409.1 hypothetical protein EXM22_16010 [Oceanispirochaeta crateris]